MPSGNTMLKVQSGTASAARARPRLFSKRKLVYLKNARKPRLLTMLRHNQARRRRRRRRRFDQQAGGVIDRGGEQNDADEPRVPPHVEDPTRHQQEAVLLRTCAQGAVDQQHDRQKDEELLGGKAHGSSSSVCRSHCAHPRNAGSVEVHEVGEIGVAQANGRRAARPAPERGAAVRPRRASVDSSQRRRDTSASRSALTGMSTSTTSTCCCSAQSNRRCK